VSCAFSEGRVGRRERRTDLVPETGCRCTGEEWIGRGGVGKGDGRRGGEEESEGDGTCTSTAARRGGEADGGDVGGISGEVSPEGVVSAVGTEERPAT
jgi:hypothetical protein